MTRLRCGNTLSFIDYLSHTKRYPRLPWTSLWKTETSGIQSGSAGSWSTNCLFFRQNFNRLIFLIKNRKLHCNQ